MNFDLSPILVHLPLWLLVLFRITGIFVVSPVFGSKTVPMKLRILFALTLSWCVYPLVYGSLAAGAVALRVPGISDVPIQNVSMLLLASAVAMELAIGALIGYGAMLPVVGMQMAGHIVDQQIGLGLAGIFNPEFDDESGAVGEFYFVLATLIFITLGGHRMVLDTLLGSFQHIPLGGFKIDSNVIGLVIALLTVMLELAIRVAAPLLCLIFLETVAMGFIARTVPQLNILSIGFPLRILLGVSILIASITVQADTLKGAFAQTLQMLNRFFTG